MPEVSGYELEFTASASNLISDTTEQSTCHAVSLCNMTRRRSASSQPLSAHPHHHDQHRQRHHDEAALGHDWIVEAMCVCKRLSVFDSAAMKGTVMDEGEF